MDVKYPIASLDIKSRAECMDTKSSMTSSSCFGMELARVDIKPYLEESMDIKPSIESLETKTTMKHCVMSSVEKRPMDINGSVENKDIKYSMNADSIRPYFHMDINDSVKGMDIKGLVESKGILLPMADVDIKPVVSEASLSPLCNTEQCSDMHSMQQCSSMHSADQCSGMRDEAPTLCSLMMELCEEGSEERKPLILEGEEDIETAAFIGRLRFSALTC